MRRACLGILGAWCVLWGCGGGDPKRAVGGACELNSECDAPLVCRLGACRTECNTTRDCPIGLACVNDADGLGICQLRSERACAMASDCPAPLACRSMQCVNECETDRDCPAGAECLLTPEGHGCIDRFVDRACVRDSECDAPERCAVDGRCRQECRTDRDCRFRTFCDPLDHACKRRPEFLDGGPDAGGGMDGAVGDGGTTDSGGGDAGGSCPATSTVDRIAAGWGHTCALVRGEVWCWGQNGELELGSVGPSSPTPRRVEGLTGASDLFAGSYHTCAVTRTGELWCWGRNAQGQLGRGSTSLAELPAPVPGLAGVWSAAAGEGHTCATVGGTELRCWGDRAGGALGDGMTTGMVTSPQLVPGVINPRDVTAGIRHTCAVELGDVVKCWGQNSRGQVGNGGVAVQSTPYQIGGFSAGLVDVFTSHTCAIVTGNTVSCWGDGSFGALGNGSTAMRTTPTAVPGLTSIAEVRTGDLFTCARSMGLTAHCWGWNYAGGLGDGTTSDRLMADGTVLDVGGAPLGGVTQLAVGQLHACALVGRDVLCWGSNDFGQLGVPVAAMGGLASRNVAARVECVP